MGRARYIMIGGFLGAGKTTSILKFAERLTAEGLKVGLITNDQGGGLVDTAMARSKRFPTEEIAGGCFCCRFNSLVEAADALSGASRPDVFLAEPVGSCTDLVATVSLPLQKIYGDAFDVAPMSVVIDAVRARRILGLEDGKKFSPNVRYIYRKQLEEAEFIVINKIDLLDDTKLAQLRDELGEQFPHARVIEVSARDGTHLDSWFDAVRTGQLDVARVMEIDYRRYGEGEALLGWLNGTVHIDSGDDEFDGNALIAQLADELARGMASAGAEVAHLKMTLTPRGDPMEIAAINLVRGDSTPELSHHLSEPLQDAELLVNMRAEAAPELLDAATSAALAGVLRERFGLDYQVDHMEHFRPGQPVPTHRITAV